MGFFIAGAGVPATEFIPGTPINRALTQAEITRMVQTNELLPVDRAGGSCAELLPQTSGAWSSVGTGTTTTTLYDLATDPDGVGIPSGATSASLALKMVRTGASNQGGAYVPNFFNTHFKGSPIKLLASVKQTSGDFEVVLTASDGSQVIPGPSTNSSVATGSGWEALDHQFTKTAPVGNAGPSIISSRNFVVYVVLPSAKALGALIQPKITPTAQVLDIGPNLIHGIATPGVRPLTSNEFSPIEFDATTTATYITASLTNPLFYNTARAAQVWAKVTNAGATVTVRKNSTTTTPVASHVVANANQWTLLTLTAANCEFVRGDSLSVQVSAGTADGQILCVRR
jgi:hypothetical protein